MKAFFDYVFYKLYRWNVIQNNSVKRLVPLQDDVLFATVFGISVMQALNIFVVLMSLSMLFEKPQWMNHIDYVIIGSSAFFYLINYLYYQRSKHYTTVLKMVVVKKKLLNALVILYFAISFILPLLMLVYYKECIK